MSINRLLTTIAAAGLCSAAVSAQISSPQWQGYSARAEAMLAEGNYQGCIDQCTAALRNADGTFATEQLHWMGAQAAFRGGYSDARERLEQFLTLYPASGHRVEAHLLLATLTFYSGDYATALSEFDAVSPTALEPGEREDLTYRQAFCRMKLGDFAESKRLFTSLQSTKTYGNASTFYLGYLAYAQGNYAEAETLLADVDTATAPGNMAPYYLAQIYYSRADYARTLTTARPLLRAADIEPEYAAEAQRLCGESLYALDRQSEGLVMLRNYFNENADVAPLSTRYILGVDDYNSGDYLQAIEMLAPVCDQTNAMGQSALLFRGLSYLSDGDNHQAIMSFDRAVKMDFDADITEVAYYNYAVASLQGGRVPFGSSVSTLEQFLSRYPNSRYAPTVQEYLINGYLSADDYDGALRAINAVPAAKRTDNVLAAMQRIYFVTGTRRYTTGDLSGAREMLLQSRALDSRNADIARQNTLWLGDTYYAQGEYAKAQTEYASFLNSASRSDANRPQATYSMGYALFGQRQYASSRSYFTTASTTEALPVAVRADALNRIADTYYYENDFASALSNYKSAYSLNPSSGDYPLYQQAMMQGHNRKYTEKIAGLDQMMSQFPSSALIPDALNQKALTQSLIGKNEQAIATYRQLADSYSSTSHGRNALLQIAILNRTMGRTDEATKYYRQVVTSYPSSAEAAAAVQDLTRIYGDNDRIDELNDFLQANPSAPQLDATERSAIAAASLLRRAKAAKDDKSRLTLANELLSKYPDADGADEALRMRADIELAEGNTQSALNDYEQLLATASTPALTHAARMGVLRSARDLGKYQMMISVADDITSSTTGSDSDLPEVRYLQAYALCETGQTTRAASIWSEMAKKPAEFYGTRAAYSLGEMQYNAGELKQAAKTVNALIDANPPHIYWLGRSFILLSDILTAQGNNSEAQEYLRSLRENYPGSEADIFQMIDSRLKK
jgi:TolA-binding protein